MLLLESDIYGFYIHGQSVHGKAEAGLRQMHENMLREEVSGVFFLFFFML